MAFDPITSISDTAGKFFEAAKEWIRVYGDPEAQRQRKLRKLNEKADKLKKRIEEISRRD